MDLKSLLNKEQYIAASTIEGQVLILAGAGSGKTRVLTHRIAYMVSELNIRPYNILAITFTNKAAKEMKDRVRALVGDEADNMWISTFHSSCVRILRREIDKLGYKKDFSIYDTSDQKTLIKHVMKELNINEKDITDGEILATIGKAKDMLITANTFKRENEGNFRKNKIADAYVLYQKKLKENNALDFVDLIFKNVELFRRYEDILEFYQNKFKYIMIDEYQDTNKAQYELVKLLADKYKNICVVGDDDQCIYEWRGADIRNILDFEKDYPDAIVVKLEQNYRSKKNILEAANSVIKNNSERKQKVLRTQQDDGEKIGIYRAYSDKLEAEFVVSKIKELVKEKELKYKDFAILYRTNAQSRVFEEVLRRSAIAYKIFGGLKFYDRKEIKDILAYLKVLVNPQDSISLRRIINTPKRSIGDATIEKIQKHADEIESTLYNALLDVEFIPGLTTRAINPIKRFIEIIEDLVVMSQTLSVSKLIQYVLEKSGYLKSLEESKSLEDESRIENLKELVSDAVDFEKNNEDKSLSAYLERVALVQDMDSMDEENNSIMLMTVHSSKGLEFPVVFMVGMENGMFPSMGCFDKIKEMEEARRLCYVGITRAKERLYMTSAESRMVFGRTVSYKESDFLKEVPEALKNMIMNETNKQKQNKATSKVDKVRSRLNTAYSNPHSIRGSHYNKYNSKSSLAVDKKLKEILSDEEDKQNLCTAETAIPGRKVKHSKFGEGTIITAMKVGADYKITIAFDNQGIKNLMLSFAHLELL